MENKEPAKPSFMTLFYYCMKNIHILNEEFDSYQKSRLVSKINESTDFYEILGVGNNSSVDEITEAYVKISLKVYPNANQTPGSEEAFKKIKDAYQSLVSAVPRDRRCKDEQRARIRKVILFAFVVLFCFIIGGLLHLLHQYLYIKPLPYSLWMDRDYKILKKTKEDGIEYYVTSPSSDFDNRYPVGTPARTDIEDTIIKEYDDMVIRNCLDELWGRLSRRDYLTPNCDIYHQIYNMQQTKNEKNNGNHTLNKTSSPIN